METIKFSQNIPHIKEIKIPQPKITVKINKGVSNEILLRRIIIRMVEYGYIKDSYQIYILNKLSTDIENNKKEIIEELESILSHRYGQRYIASGRVKLPKYMITEGKNNHDKNEKIKYPEQEQVELEYDTFDNQIIDLINNLKKKL